MDALKHMFDLQEEFENRWFNFSELTEVEKQELTNEFVGHCIEELIEFRQELPARKHWKKDNCKPANVRKMKLEYSDIMHFLITIALINGWSADDVYKSFIKKHQVNNDRQDKFGYGNKPEVPRKDYDHMIG